MTRERRAYGLLRHIYAHWPLYFLGFGGGATLILVLTLLATGQGWLSLIPVNGALLLILGYFLGARLWAASRLYDGEMISSALVELGDLRANAGYVHIDIGRRLPLRWLLRHLAGGRLIAVDIYNPLAMPGNVVQRWRESAPQPERDPRLETRQGSFELLPLPDSAVQTVTMLFTLSHLWQRGDQLRLLDEIHRILRPGGRLLMVERGYSRTNFLLFGPTALRLPQPADWQSLLAEAGLQPRERRSLQDLAICFVARKPEAPPQQLSLFCNP